VSAAAQPDWFAQNAPPQRDWFAQNAPKTAAAKTAPKESHESAPEYGSTGFEAYGETLQTPEGRKQQTATLKSLAPGVAGTGASMVAGPWAGAGAYVGTKAALFPEEVKAHPIQTAFETAAFPAAEYAPAAIGAMARPALRGVGKAASAVGDVLGNEFSGAISPRAYHVGRMLSGAGKVATRLGAEPPVPVYPGAPLPEAPEPITNVLHGPEKPPIEVLQARGLAKGGQPGATPSDVLGNIPVRPTRVAIPSASPTAPSAATGAYEIGPRPVIQRGPIPGSPEDLAESQAIEERVRNAAEQEGHTINSQVKREWFANNAPGTTKGELTGTPEKPVKFTKTPGIAPPKAQKAIPPGVVPKPEEDMTPLLQKSVERAKAAKAVPEGDTIFARNQQLKDAPLNVTGMQGDRNVINPVLQKELPKWQADKFTGKSQWTYDEVQDMINSLTNGRMNKAKAAAVELLRSKIAPVTAQIEGK
jgi:hypothetical protein